CLSLELNGSRYCEWNYNGLGLDYQILAGPSFIAVFTIVGVALGIAADKYNRVKLLTVCTLIFSIAIVLMGAVGEYWQLVILRMILAAGEAGCNPLATGLLSDWFPEKQRGLVMSIFNWGIYGGYGIAFPVGRYIPGLNIGNLGWRACYYGAGIIGLIMAALTFTLSEPERKTIGEEGASTSGKKTGIWKVILQPRVILLCIAASIRHCVAQKLQFLYKPYALAVVSVGYVLGELGHYLIGVTSKATAEDLHYGDISCQLNSTTLSIVDLPIQCEKAKNESGMCFAYNCDLYYRDYFPDYDLGWWLFAVTIVIGSIGVVVGGVISDKFVAKMGIRSRVAVLAISQIIATPFAFSSVYFNPLWAMITLGISYFFAEMWFGIVFAVVVEIVPLHFRSTTIGAFLFVMNNIGGNLPILVEPTRRAIGFRESLYIFYAGFYGLSSILFFSTMFFMDGAVKEQPKPEISKIPESGYDNSTFTNDEGRVSTLELPRLYPPPPPHRFENSRL
ncbi:hypothetical protein E2986_08014, partial [Frieseomelitta varia]